MLLLLLPLDVSYVIGEALDADSVSNLAACSHESRVWARGIVSCVLWPRYEAYFTAMRVRVRGAARRRVAAQHARSCGGCEYVRRIHSYWTREPARCVARTGQGTRCRNRSVRCSLCWVHRHAVSDNPFHISRFVESPAHFLGVL